MVSVDCRSAPLSVIVWGRRVRQRAVSIAAAFWHCMKLTHASTSAGRWWNIFAATMTVNTMLFLSWASALVYLMSQWNMLLYLYLLCFLLCFWRPLYSLIWHVDCVATSTARILVWKEGLLQLQEMTDGEGCLMYFHHDYIQCNHVQGCWGMKCKKWELI